MSNWSQNCWIDWNSALLCFETTFSHRSMNVCPICEASLSHYTLCMGNLSGSNNRVYVFNGWQKIFFLKEGSSPHRFWIRPTTRNRRLFFLLYNESYLDFCFDFFLDGGDVQEGTWHHPSWPRAQTQGEEGSEDKEVRTTKSLVHSNLRDVYYYFFISLWWDANTKCWNYRMILPD